MAGAGAKPSPGPLLPIPGRTLCQSSAWGSRWTASSPPSLRPTLLMHRVGGWGVLGESMSLSSMVLEKK